DYIATYMYEDDTPPAERRAQALSLDRDLLRELLGQEELRDLLDAGAVEEVETQLRGAPRNADQLHDQLRLRGDLREGEYDEGFAQTLLRERRALLVRFAAEQRLIAAEDAGRYRDALGVMPPGGLPEVFLEGGDESLEQLVVRFARGRGPFTSAEANERFGRDLEPRQGLSLPVSLWEAEVLPRRVPGFNPGQLDQLCASGELVWVGAGLDRVSVYFREDAPALGRPAAAPRPEGAAHDAIRAALG